MVGLFLLKDLGTCKVSHQSKHFFFGGGGSWKLRYRLLQQERWNPWVFASWVHIHYIFRGTYLIYKTTVVNCNLEGTWHLITGLTSWHQKPNHHHPTSHLPFTLYTGMLYRYVRYIYANHCFVHIYSHNIENWPCLRIPPGVYAWPSHYEVLLQT